MPYPTRYQPYQYKKGQMYDPFQMANIMQPGIPGKTTGYQFGQQGAAAEGLGKELSWLYGGRPLTGQEIQPLLGREGYDPRMGTIGGMRSLKEMATDFPVPGSVTPRGGVVQPWDVAGRPGTGGARYAPLKGFGATDRETGQPMVPYKEVGIPLQTRQEYTALEQAPYELAEQYKRIADQGIFGVAGMNTIYQRGIKPAMDRYKRLIPETLTSIRQAESLLRDRAARALGKSLGGQFASQPGLAAKLIGDQVLAPSLARQAEMSMDLQTMVAQKLAALDLAVGDLLKENMQSKMMGLAGIQDVMGFLQGRVADRWWDLSMENKFGWSPERIAAAKGDVQADLMRLANELGMSMMELEYKFREWLMERQYELEEGRAGGSSGAMTAIWPFGGGEGGDYKKLLGG